MCIICGFIYDEAQGWPQDNIPPNTLWADVPADWMCPDCSAMKDDFEMIEVDKVSLNIFDVAGRKVASLIKKDVMTPGHHKISWNPGLLPSGVYLVELVTSVKSFNQKITYIK